MVRYLSRVYPRERCRAPVTIVEVDARALQHFGQWPWPRRRLADLIVVGNLGALSIGLDIIMAESDRLLPRRTARRIGKDDRSLWQP